MLPRNLGKVELDDSAERVCQISFFEPPRGLARPAKYLLPESAGMNVVIHRKANECKADLEANFTPQSPLPRDLEDH
jgi:hypothetical protein